MVISALSRLRHRSAQLNAKLTKDMAAEIAPTREMLRLSLVELYKLGYWRENPDEFRFYMRQFRARTPVRINAQPSKSALGKTDQCSP